MNHSFLQGLNPEQAEAARHVWGPMLILAGAGSGKTTVLVARTRYLIEEVGIDPAEIGVVTFTNKAARELKQRIGQGEGPRKSRKQSVWTGTFHRMGLEILRTWPQAAGLEKQFGIIDQSDCDGILKDLLSDLHVAGKEAFHTGILQKSLNHLRSLQAVSSQPKDPQISEEYWEVAEVLLPKYRSRLRQLGVVDFEDLLLLPIQLIQQDETIRTTLQQRYRHLMVDEFQDTNSQQMKLITSLTGTDGNLTVVGDDDQSIYGWRGAEVQNILNFPQRFQPCKIVKLVRNYRCTPQILSVANTVIAKNKARHEKELIAQAEPGEKPELFLFDDEDGEISNIEEQIRYFTERGFQHQDIAILYRSNSLGGLCEGLLRKSQIPYTITGGQGLFDRKEVKDALSYIRCAMRPTELAFRRIINCPPRGVGEKTFDEIRAREESSTYLQAQSYAREKSHAGLETLFSQLRGFRENLSSSSLICDFMKSVGYWQLLLKTSKNAEAARQRWVSLEILDRIRNSFEGNGESPQRLLMDFIDYMELRDVERDKEQKGIQLLTLHACKGLEFPVVLMIGLEEDILPHKTLGGDIDEERRLFYVGVTRAKKHLVLSHSRNRSSYGRSQAVTPSRFLSEVPHGMLDVRSTGWRPVSSEQRAALVSDFFSKLENRIGQKS